MKDYLARLLFGEESLLRQAYTWFAISLLGFGTSFFLPTRALIICTNAISWLALTVSAQDFIASAKANKKLASKDQGRD